MARLGPHGQSIADSGLVVRDGPIVDGVTLGIDPTAIVHPDDPGNGDLTVAYLENHTDNPIVVGRNHPVFGFDEDIFDSAGVRLAKHDPRGPISIAGPFQITVPAHGFYTYLVRVVSKYDFDPGTYTIRLRMRLLDGRTVESGMGRLLVATAAH